MRAGDFPTTVATRIKICGITREADALAVGDAGADAVGFNFSAASTRWVPTETAGKISRRIAGCVLRVGLFVDQPGTEIRRILQTVDLDLLQFHGQEPAEFCRSFGKPYMKVFRVAGPFAAAKAEADYPDACALLLDAYVAGQPGGTGQRLDLRNWPASSNLPLVLAGGLTPANVRHAVEAVKPFAVDVCGGVEGTAKGRKDAGKIAAFVQEVRDAGS